MILKKVKAEGLAHLSYLIGAEGRAAVIDPRRDCGVYLDIARMEGLKITDILETHRNEDYVTGSRELAALTEARIHHGDLPFGYGQTIREGDEIDLGQVLLRAIATPGHTPESMSYVIVDRSSGPEAIGVFTGDALFVGEVGRTDLLGRERAEALAAQLYESIHHKLLQLGPGVIIFPAHGAGSACGGSISNREESTIGLEIAQNHALKIGSKDKFVEMKLAEVLEKPYYFAHMEDLNLQGQPVLGRLPEPPLLSPREFKDQADGGGIVLDVRAPESFASAHVDGAISIPMEVMPNYAGWMLDYDRPILLVLEVDGDLKTVVRELVRIGYDRLIGYLGGGMLAWNKAGLPIRGFPVLTAKDVFDRRASGAELFVLDVRTEREWVEGRAEGAIHIFVGFLKKRIGKVPRDRAVAVMCSSGLRSSLGSSILQNAGFNDIYNVLGGMNGWKRSGLPTVK